MTISARTNPEVPLPTTLFHGGATSVETGILKPKVFVAGMLQCADVTPVRSAALTSTVVRRRS
jgi:hypothetical protein